MKAFSELLEKLYFTNSQTTKASLIKQYLADTPDPDRGWAIAAIAGTLRFDLFKRALTKRLMLERVDETLFSLCYDYVGELSETVAHLWPSNETNVTQLPTLHEVVSHFKQATKAEVERYLIQLLDQMTPAQRWALLKLGTRGMRVGVSARSIKRILADYGGKSLADIEALWHGVEPPYTDLLLWLDGKADVPDISNKVTYQPVMLSHPLDETKFEQLGKAYLNPEEWQVEWKYDGIRVQLVSTPHGKALFSRTGDDISHSFPDLLDSVDFHAVFDGELLIVENGQVGSFNQLQQRLNKKKPSKKLCSAMPAGIMLYDALSIGSLSLMDLPLQQRRLQLADWYQQMQSPRFLLSETLPASSIQQLCALRKQATDNALNAIEGIMLKRHDSPYISGRPANQWLKWKRDPFVVDAIMMYAQRGSGKRSSYYSDFTFGVWQDDTIVPIGKAYSGFTNDELKQLDRWVRQHTVGRFGPVKEVEKSLVLEVAFDSAHDSKRHKSGVALRFPRISRIRWDKPAHEADSVESVKQLIR
ncbi:cisplatin damage response ATP-dependent DNA ligase [Alteromonas facilis]|uniref:cisplatin damage response ATP-dependent DNA ligase n=1 Tax=Alteromonas facilis TaxID=2048004 RepID=UPI000C289482|nr:cisplatin damage response ATP-dependent DNA ligase [Alteromonas facilis]